MCLFLRLALAVPANQISMKQDMVTYGIFLDPILFTMMKKMIDWFINHAEILDLFWQDYKLFWLLCCIPAEV